MGKNIITVSDGRKHEFCQSVSLYLTEFLGKKVSKRQVFDELFLYENKMDSLNEKLSSYLKEILKYGIQNEHLRKKLEKIREEKG